METRCPSELLDKSVHESSKQWLEMGKGLRCWWLRKRSRKRDSELGSSPPPWGKGWMTLREEASMQGPWELMCFIKVGTQSLDLMHGWEALKPSLMAELKWERRKPLEKHQPTVPFNRPPCPRKQPNWQGFIPSTSHCEVPPQGQKLWQQ